MPRKNAEVYSAYTALFVATALWGAAGPVIKLTLNYVPVNTLLFLRFLIICIPLLPVVILELKKKPVDKKDIPYLIVLGILSQTSLIITFLGYKFTTALDASLIGVTYPLIAIAAGRYFYKEKISDREKLGIFIATLGTLLIVFEPLFFNHSTQEAKNLRVLGNSLILFYQFTWLAYIIWSKQIMGHSSRTLNKAEDAVHIKRMKNHYSPTLITFVSFYVGLATFTPLAILESLGLFGSENAFDFADFSFVPVAGVLYLAIFSSIVAYTLHQKGVDKVHIGDTALFTYLGPVFAFPTAYILLREIPTSETIAGAAVIGAGVIVAEYKKS